MTQLSFTALDIVAEPYAAAPQLTARLRIGEPPDATSYSASNSRSWLRYSSTNRRATDRSTSGSRGGMAVWVKSGDAQN